jgi:hypothetical protein
MLPAFRHLCLSACLSLALGLAARAADISPFMPPAAASAATAVTPDSPLELRGIMADGGAYMFSIYDSARKASTWARLNESGREFVIKSHDEARDIITVEQNGRQLTLALKVAKVASAPAGAPRPVAGPNLPAPVGGPVVLNPTPADEQRRLEAVAAEVRRRRALREQAAQGAAQTQK